LKNAEVKIVLLLLIYIKAIVESIENIDGIVHAAGIVSLAPVKFYSEELMNEMRSINFDSIVYLVNLIFKKKKINKGSSIVLISSIAGLYGMKGNGIYAASKGALIAISKVWASEFATSKTRVNCVSPGMVKTEITAKSIENLSLEVIQEDEKKYPLGYGDSVQVANPIVFLLSEASSWITGQNIILDGGRTSTI
jgi:NAD(P)-dependent dehydrogenase (short-subunit alcohol dehydrogenase family)